MIVTIDAASPVPPYEQLRQAIRRLVATGDLAVGARLPSVRQLAGDLGLAPGTVARSFRELEAEGIVATRGRRGTHVAGVPAPVVGEERHRRLSEAAVVFAATVAELGADPGEAVAEVGRALAQRGRPG